MLSASLPNGQTLFGIKAAGKTSLHLSPNEIPKAFYAVLILLNLTACGASAECQRLDSSNLPYVTEFQEKQYFIHLYMANLHRASRIRSWRD
jgi:hypothetical protein